MKVEALRLAGELSDPGQKLNVLREYLQACILRSLHESEAFACLSFVGGTALRFLFHLHRFSEDLDFSLEGPEGYDPKRWMVKLGRDLTAQGFEPAIRWNDRRTVHVGWVRMPGLLREVGLANLREQKLSIKLEIDTLPPAGATKQSGVVNRHVIFAVRYHDLPSLMAGKIHALLARPYSKGRDWYDLLWYLSRRPLLEPNLRLLQNALDQTEGESSMVAGEWRQSVRVRVDNLAEDVIREDVASFLERPQDAQLLTRDNLIEILDRD